MSKETSAEDIHLAGLARGDTLTWNTIKSKQYVRVLDAPTKADRTYELYLFVIAVRNVLRAAELARKVASRMGRRASAQRINEAIEAFDEAVEHGRDVRDILEHFDAYRLGKGNLQTSRKMTGFLEWVEDDGTGPTLVYGNEFRLNADRASAACDFLASEVLEALELN